MALILQLDSAGQPNKWITWKQAVVYKSKDLISWQAGRVETVVRGGTNARTGEQSIVVTSSILAVKGPSKRKHRVPALNNRELFRRDQNTCAYCGHTFSDVKLTRDHIIPKSHNGQDTWMNCVTACTKCNQHKDNRTPEQANMLLLFAPFVPTRAEHLILANRNILADQMEFLLGFVGENSRVRASLTKQ